MTDKEKLEKVKAEIERRYNYHKDHADDYAGTEYFWKADEDRGLLSFIDSMQEESVSEVLEEAAENYASTDEVLLNGKVMIDFQAEKAFRAGANWQKQQMMKEAVSGHVGQTINGMLRALSDETFGDMGFMAGDKVKLIIIKEE